MSMWKEVMAVVLTASIWCVYAYCGMKMEGNFDWPEWFQCLAALSFPVIVCGLVALNIWLGTSFSCGIFIVFICFGSLWALGSMKSG